MEAEEQPLERQEEEDEEGRGRGRGRRRRRMREEDTRSKKGGTQQKNLKKNSKDKRKDAKTGRGKETNDKRKVTVKGKK